MLGKNTILKAIHNGHHIHDFPKPLRMLGKNTILKAIHNHMSVLNRVCLPANAR